MGAQLLVPFAVAYVVLCCCCCSSSTEEVTTKEDSGVSAVGDPGMERDGLRVGFEAWNFCNEVGKEEAPSMGSPRAADCFDLSSQSNFCYQIYFTCVFFRISFSELIEFLKSMRWNRIHSVGSPVEFWSTLLLEPQKLVILLLCQIRPFNFH